MHTSLHRRTDREMAEVEGPGSGQRFLADQKTGPQSGAGRVSRFIIHETPPGLSWSVASARTSQSRPPRRKGLVRRVFRWCLVCGIVVWSLAAVCLFSLRWIDPPFTAVHVERRVQAWMHKDPYHERYVFVRLNRIAPDLQHAVVAAEDARFFQHHGFDWHEIRTAVDDDLEKGRGPGRGAS